MIDYSWCAFSKPKDQKKATGDKKATVEKEVSEKSGQLKPKKPLQAKTKLKAKTPINKVSKKKETVTKKIYNAVLERDKCCRLCGINKDLQLHHIMRSWQRQNKQYIKLHNAM